MMVKEVFLRLDKMKAGADKKITHLKEFRADRLKQLLLAG